MNRTLRLLLKLIRLKQIGEKITKIWNENEIFNFYSSFCINLL